MQCFSKNGQNLSADLSELETLLNIDLEDIEECEDRNTEIKNEPNENPEMLIYPNPFKGKLIIESQTEIDEIVIFNNIGQAGYNEKSHVDKVELEGLESGIYNLVIITRSGLSAH